MKNIDHALILDSLRGTLLGEVYPDIISIAYKFNVGKNEFTLMSFLDREPVAYDFECLRDIMDYTISYDDDFWESIDISFKCVYVDPLDNKAAIHASQGEFDHLVFARKPIRTFINSEMQGRYLKESLTYRGHSFLSSSPYDLLDTFDSRNDREVILEEKEFAIVSFLNEVGKYVDNNGLFITTNIAKINFTHRGAYIVPVSHP